MEKKKTTSNDILEKYKKYINPSLARILKVSGADKIETKSRGVYIKDQQGKKYIDCLGGYGTFNLGHSHPKVVEAIRKQLRKIPLSSKIFLNEQLANLCELLAKITPGNLQYSFICNSGTEAVEGALKLARLYTKKTKIISAFNSFHGKTLGALSASGRDIYKKPFEPLLPGFVQVPYGDIDAIEKEIDDNTAAIILEPIQGEGGVIIPDIDFLPQVREICTKQKILLIIDEVQTGMGRCGYLFACEHYNIVPDILIMAKSLGGGVMPIGAFISTEEIWKAFLPNPLLHTSTFGGGELACAAAIAGIKVTIEENLPQKAKESGAYFLSKLSYLSKKYPEIIKTVRGLGLLIGVELQKEGFGGMILPEMIKQGVLIAYTLNNPKVIRFEPPLIITKDIIDEVISAFENVLEKIKPLADRI